MFTQFSPSRSRLAEVILFAGAAALLIHRLDTPVLFDDPNDGQYAEVGREMHESGDWISPTLNGTLFLNKPPLLYWLIATSDAAFGVNEAAARLPGAVATFVTVILVYLLGHVLFGRRAGLLAACAYVAMPSIWIEARFVRPDSLLTCCVSGILLAFSLLMRDPKRHALPALILAVSAAAGVLSKGMIALLLPAFPVALTILLEKRWDLLSKMFSPLTLASFFLLVGPWHLAAALRHEGFAWDYIVNQHFLFFLDRKLPRDSIPIPLWIFWSAFFGRTFPLCLFLPWGIASSRSAASTPETNWPRRFLLAWLGGVLLFFSLNVSRLEHYCLPALPAVALLVASLAASQPTGRPFRIPLAALLFIAATGFFAAPEALTRAEWLAELSSLPNLARICFATFVLASILALILLRSSPDAVLPLLALASVCLVPVGRRGLESLSPVNSSAPLADLLEKNGGKHGRVVFEAPTEYQSCAGLNFYLRRRVDLLRPTDFVDPPYLFPHRHELFLTIADLGEIWKREPVLFVSNPLLPRDRRLEGITPGPFDTIGFVSNRWVLRNRVDAE